MSESSSICLACGLCCDGTLIGFVQLDREELPAVKKVMEIEEANEEGFFLQPCDNYCDGCTIYTNRPRQCGYFKCGLLKSVEQKTLDYELAVDIIDVVKQQTLAIEKKVAMLPFKLKSPSFYFKMVELKKILHTNLATSPNKDQAELMLAINKLDDLLIDKFDVSLS